LQVIKHELSYGPLDFNFQNNNQDAMAETVVNGSNDAQQHSAANHGQYQPARASNSWVH
jgi:hypothetical protein